MASNLSALSHLNVRNILKHGQNTNTAGVDFTLTIQAIAGLYLVEEGSLFSTSFTYDGAPPSAAQSQRKEGLDELDIVGNLYTTMVRVQQSNQAAQYRVGRQ